MESDLSQNDFYFYHHLKPIMKNQSKQCRDTITSTSAYCLKCKESTCNVCTLKDHQGHQIMNSLPYYTNENNQIVINHFQDLRKILDNSSTSAINIPYIRNCINQLIEAKFDELTAMIAKVKASKLKEINKLFSKSEESVETMRNQITKLQELLADFIVSNNAFFELTPSFKTDTISNEITRNGYVNHDFGNSCLLMRYDLFDASTRKNKEIMTIIEDLNKQTSNYQKDFINQVDESLSILQKMLVPCKELFKYNELSKNTYASIQEKMTLFNELIETCKNSIFDSVAKYNSFEEIDKMNILSDLQNKQPIDTILNTDPIAQNMNSPILTETSNTKRRNKKTIDGGKTTNTYSLMKSMTTRTQAIPIQLLTKEEVTMKHLSVQKYFTYHLLELLKKLNRIRKRGLHNMYDDLDIAKPIPNTNEIQIYDKKTQTSTKKKVTFDKSKHQFNYFLNGSRCVFVKDRLYITGGVDKEKNECNICYVYYLKTNELKAMPSMLNNRAYHAIEFLQYFKSLIVIGGENNATCELYDMYTSKWKPMPSLNYPRAHCSIYLDGITKSIYSCFGVEGNLLKTDTYSDVIEKIELRKANCGWFCLNYPNKSEMDFKMSFCRIYPIDYERLLIYGASSGREYRKTSAIFLMKNYEVVKLDNKTLDEIRQCAMTSSKLTEIISRFI